MTSLKKFKVATLLSTKLIFMTAVTGAFVAGLDAGLLYNTFPKMGLNWIPPSEELFLPHIKSTWKNFTENPTLVQFIHRCMGIVTFCSVLAIWAAAMRSRSLAKNSNASSLRSIRTAFHAMISLALCQVSLGIATLLYCVPISLAAAHQAGSLSLLSMAIYALSLFKRLVLRH